MIKKDMPSERELLLSQIAKLQEENKVLNEQVRSQQDMLRETTSYMQKIQEDLQESEAKLMLQKEVLEKAVEERTYELRMAYEEIKLEVEERKIIQGELLDTNKELNTLLYKASHDLKAPVSTSYGLLNLLKVIDNRDEFPLYISMIESTLGKLDLILKELTKIVSIKQEKELVFEDIVVRGLCSEVWRKFKPLTSDFRTSFCVDVEHVHSNQELLSLVLEKVIGNAIKYKVKEGASLALKVFEEKGYIKFEVKDNGEGIEPSLLPHVYDMFYKGNTNSKGSGMGLYIAKGALKRLGGGIEIISTIGVGTIACISVPKQV
ncbi:HAMP domain-containing sensor histidine kinase [Cytophagaceae bacterium ABcell3]|nr:HAMP domain-containing sensor histidine kinase [Cytophagaceae bacterium ABcell3]